MSQKSIIHRLLHSEAGIVFLIFALAVGIRLFAVAHTYIVNPDGTGYIYQARAVYYDRFDAINNCSVPFLSSYPFMIAALYPVFGGWLLSARVVSLTFGTLFLVPIYLLSRRFFKMRTAAAVLVIYALMPVFVGRSADVLRDPVFWFFGAAGLYLFLRNLEKEDAATALLAGGCFLAAVSARVEAVLYLTISAGFILFARGNRKTLRLFSFLLPAVLVCVLFLWLSPGGETSTNAFSRVSEIGRKITAPVEQYGHLQNALAEMVNRADIPQQNRLFIHAAKNMIWLVGVGSVLVYALESFFFPYVPFFLIGLFLILRAKRRLGKREIYFLLSAAAALFLLIAHTLDVWILEDRFFAVAILPSFLFAGLGIERIAEWIERRFSLKTAAVWGCILLFITASALSIDLRQREPEKAVFQAIGERIAVEKQPGATAVVSAPGPVQGWVAFYANLDVPGVFCALDYAKCWDMWKGIDGAAGFMARLRERGAQYLLFCERLWPKARFDPRKPAYRNELVPIGTWTHPDTGKMILYKVAGS